MDALARLDSVSPLEYRYLNSPEADAVRGFISEEALVKYLGIVEVALVRAYCQVGICGADIGELVAKAATQVTAREVYEEEAKVRHEVRAFVNCLADKAGPKAAPWVHLAATSEDVMGTANALRYRDFCYKLLLPALWSLEKILIGMAREHQDTCQIGRTHGQHAVPLTFGFALAEYVSRLGGRIVKIQETAAQLRGKFAGAVGAYNAQSLLLANPLEFETKFLSLLGLAPADHSTQIVEPEYLLDLMHSMTSAFGVLGNLADDMRHLQRSEIHEVAEQFGSAQVGSSTMPHKQNPISFEHIKSLWKSFMPRVMTCYLDQISEHQRDLTNSASARFYGEIFCGLYLAALRLQGTLQNLAVDKAALQSNLRANWDKIVAEPCYIILARHGRTQAHETVRKWVHAGKKLPELVEQELGCKLSDAEKAVLSGPEHYIGWSRQKCAEVCRLWEDKVAAMEKRLAECKL